MIESSCSCSHESVLLINLTEVKLIIYKVYHRVDNVEGVIVFWRAWTQHCAYCTLCVLGVHKSVCT